MFWFVAELTVACARNVDVTRLTLTGVDSGRQSHTLLITLTELRLRTAIYLYTKIKGNSISQLRSVTCRMGSHSATCHPTQVNTPRLNHSCQTGQYSIYLPTKDGRPSYGNEKPTKT